jgi:5-methylcytosine-specific restriction endonuclease McrA
MNCRDARPYDDPWWRRLRPAILGRDSHTCMSAGPRWTTVATQVDHIVSWRELPEDQWFAPELLRAACRSCNSRAGARRQAQLADFGRRRLRDKRRDW